MALAFTAVLLPMAVLSVVQYRSLQDLEGKTRVAVEENLRQTLQSISRRAKERLEALAAETLKGIEAADVEQERLDRIFRKQERDNHALAAAEGAAEKDQHHGENGEEQGGLEDVGHAEKKPSRPYLRGQMP